MLGGGSTGRLGSVNLICQEQKVKIYISTEKEDHTEDFIELRKVQEVKEQQVMNFISKQRRMKSR